MQQSTLGVLALSLLIVSFFSLGNYGAPIATQNVAQTMNGTGAFVGSSAPANVTGSGGFGSSPANPAPSTSSTPAPSSANSNEQKPPETGSSTKCPEGTECKTSTPKEIQKLGDCNNPGASVQTKEKCAEQEKIAKAQISKCTQGKADKKQCEPYEIEKVVYTSSACLVKAGKTLAKCNPKPTDECPTVSSTTGKVCRWDSNEPGCQCQSSGSPSANPKDFQADDGKKYDISDIQKRLAAGEQVSAAEGDALEEYELASGNNAMDEIWSSRPAETPIASDYRASDGNTYDVADIQNRLSNGGAVSAAESAALEEYEIANSQNLVQQGSGMGLGGSTGLDGRMNLGGTVPSSMGAGGVGSGGATGGASAAAPASNGQSRPVTGGGGGGGNPAANAGSAGVGGQGGSNFGGGSNTSSASSSGSNTGAQGSGYTNSNTSQNYGPLSGNYNSLQQYQPYGNNNNGLGRLAQNVMQQQQSYGYTAPQNNGTSYTPPAAGGAVRVSQGGISGMLGNFINSLTGAASNPEGVVYYQNQPIASYRTEDGAIVIDRVRIPRQTPQADSSTTPADLVQALAASDVSVAARIRSAVSSGGITLAVPTNPNDQNQSFANIENLIIQDEVAAALRIAEEAAIVAKDSIACEVEEAAQDCLNRRLAAAQEIERRVFVDELNRRPLSENAVAHFVGLYDGVANPNGAASYESAVPSILSQLNQPQQTGIINTVVTAVGAAIDATVRFIANVFGSSAAEAY